MLRVDAKVLERNLEDSGKVNVKGWEVYKNVKRIYAHNYKFKKIDYNVRYKFKE